MSTEMDNGTDFILERSIRGTVVNSHNMIYGNKCRVYGKATSGNLHFFVIDKMRFLSIAKKDSFLMLKLKKMASSYLQLSKES
jgi:hypothetical protein